MSSSPSTSPTSTRRSTSTRSSSPPSRPSAAPGYANFAVDEPPLKLVLIENPDAAGTLNHLGVEVFSTDEVAAAQARLAGDGLATATEENVTCCYAVQDKVWVDDPDGAPWEIYTVLADSDAPAGELAQRRRLRRRRLRHHRPAADQPARPSPAAAERGAVPRSAAHRRGGRHRAARRRRRRVGHRRPAALARRRRPAAPREQPRDRRRPRRPDPRLRVRCPAPTSTRWSPWPTGPSAGWPPRDALAYIAAQVVGACVGACVANLMFDLAAVNLSTHARVAGGLWLGEVVATFGLLIVILGVVRSGRAAAAPVRRRRLHRRRLLVHLLDELRQPRRDHRPHADRHLRRDRARRRRPPFIAAQLVGGAPRHRPRPLPLSPTSRPPTSSCPRSPDRWPTVPPDRAVPLRPQRRPLPDGARLVQPPRRRPGHRPVRRLRTRRQVNPVAVAAMAEVGIDIAGEHPSRWTDETRGRRRRRHDGLRRHLPLRPRQALRGLGARGPRRPGPTPSAPSATRSAAASNSSSPTLTSP